MLLTKTMGFAYVSVNGAEPVACCTKIIIIQYSQATIENLVIYSAISYFTEVAGAGECDPGPFCNPGISRLS